MAWPDRCAAWPPGRRSADPVRHSPYCRPERQPGSLCPALGTAPPSRDRLRTARALDVADPSAPRPSRRAPSPPRPAPRPAASRFAGPSRRAPRSLEFASDHCSSDRYGRSRPGQGSGAAASARVSARVVLGSRLAPERSPDRLSASARNGCRGAHLTQIGGPGRGTAPPGSRSSDRDRGPAFVDRAWIARGSRRRGPGPTRSTKGRNPPPAARRARMAGRDRRRWRGVRAP